MNFALILFLLTVATGAVWLLDRLWLARRRAPDAPVPAWIEYPVSFFPVILIVFLLRPTLEVGDFILVNKFAYGIRLPILERKVIETGNPQRGDVVVFRYPVNPSQDFIKRVVGVPGDTVEYRDKKLAINGTPLARTPDGNYSWLEGLRFETTERFVERAVSERGTHDYTIAVSAQAPTVYPQNVRTFPGREHCDYNTEGFVCRVPPGNYFMMGDNRDFSDDSRYWGFVPDDHIRGKAFFIWFNWDDLSSFAFRRVGSGIR